MPITERTLRKWRKEALEDSIAPRLLAANDGVDEGFCVDEIKELSDRILRMTQELLDQHLLRKGGNR
jgi:hypothetical protein